MTRNLPLIPVVLLAITLVAMIAGCYSLSEPPATDADYSLPTVPPALVELVETPTTEPEPARGGHCERTRGRCACQHTVSDLHSETNVHATAQTRFPRRR